MSVRTDVLLWARRTIARAGAPPHELLEIKSDASADEAQAAFHKIARLAHPDLHRGSFTPEDLELVVTAYARVAGAYQDFRVQRGQRGRPAPAARSTSSATPPSGPLPKPQAPTEPASSSSGASGAMNSKALVYYRKAELCLRRGDIKGAVLQLKMAIAADPGSSLLRTALAEVLLELQKG